jgi:hypothetical protein
VATPVVDVYGKVLVTAAPAVTVAVGATATVAVGDAEALMSGIEMLAVASGVSIAGAATVLVTVSTVRIPARGVTGRDCACACPVTLRMARLAIIASATHSVANHHACFLIPSLLHGRKWSKAARAVPVLAPIKYITQ